MTLKRPQRRSKRWSSVPDERATAPPIDDDAVGGALTAIASSSPLVHHLTNDVTTSETANVTLHWGGLPVMAGAPAFAQEQVMSLDDKVNEVFANSTGWFVSLIFSNFPGTTFPWIVAWLVIGASIFTIYFAFVQFRFFSHAIKLVKGEGVWGRDIPKDIIWKYGGRIVPKDIEKKAKDYVVKELI